MPSTDSIFQAVPHSRACLVVDSSVFAKELEFSHDEVTKEGKWRHKLACKQSTRCAEIKPSSHDENEHA